MTSRCLDSVETPRKNRRSDRDRRAASDRRDLIRFEDFGNDRRAGIQRRDSEFYWKRGFYPEAEN